MIRDNDRIVFNVVRYHGPKDNDRIVFNVIKHHGPITRPHIVRLTGLPRTTVYDALRRLELAQYIGREIEERTTRGRPKIFWEIV